MTAPPWLETHVLDLDNTYTGLDKKGREALASATHIVETVAPIADFDEDPLLALHADCFDEQWVAYCRPPVCMATTPGAWIDENAPLRCTDAKSKARVGAERAFANHDAVGCDWAASTGPAGRSSTPAADGLDVREAGQSDPRRRHRRRTDSAGGPRRTIDDI